MTPARIVYLVLRALTLCVAILLGLIIISAFIWVPFYANEGNTVQFQDRIRGLIGDCLLFIAIIIPYRWTVATPYYQIRMGLIIMAAAWMLTVDTMAYSAGLTRQQFTPFSWSAIIVAIVLSITLYMRRARKEFARDSMEVPNKSLDRSAGRVFRNLLD
jgi:uncharacterized membrane protein (DUF485 family)